MNNPIVIGAGNADDPAIREAIAIAHAKNAMKSRPLIAIGTIGAIDHGKTTLTAAITSALANQGKPAPENGEETPAPENQERGITINTEHVEYKPERVVPERRHKPHVNIGMIGHVDHGKTTLTAAITSSLAQAMSRLDHEEHERQRKEAEQQMLAAAFKEKTGAHVEQVMVIKMSNHDYYEPSLNEAFPKKNKEPWYNKFDKKSNKRREMKQSHHRGSHRRGR